MQQSKTTSAKNIRASRSSKHSNVFQANLDLSSRQRQDPKTPTRNHLWRTPTSIASSMHLSDCAQEVPGTLRSFSPRSHNHRATHQIPGAASECRRCTRQHGVSTSSLQHLYISLHVQLNKIPIIITFTLLGSSREPLIN